MKKIAFAGNPNSGKSSIINMIASKSLKTGNWSGVTTEIEEVLYHYEGETYNCIDLPGFYGFHHGSDEEKVTINFFRNETCDCIVNVIDGTALINSLSCTLELRELQIPMLILLNFEDERINSNIDIKMDLLQRRLGIPVLSLSSYTLSKQEIIKHYIRKQCMIKPLYHPLYPAEIDRLFVDYVNFSGEDMKTAIYHFNLIYPSQCESARLKAVESMKSYVSQNRSVHLDFTLWFDRIIFKPLIGFLFLGFTLYISSWVVFNFVHPIIQIIDSVFKILVIIIKSISLLPSEASYFIINGLMESLRVIFSFIPIIASLTFLMGILEDSGIMTRIALLNDYYLRKIRLSGKSMIVFILGLGCNVPAIAAAASLEENKVREKSVLLVPLISCSGRLPIYFFFAERFFKDKAAVLIFFIYGTVFLIFCILSLLLSNGKSKPVPKPLELSYYRLPNLKKTLQKTSKECRHYLLTTGKTVFWALLVLWALMNIPVAPSESVLTWFAKKISFLFVPLGFGQYWQMTASLFPSLIAKESVVAFLLLCDSSLSFIPNNDYASVISFLLFCATMVPCITSCSMMKNKHGTKIMIKSVLLMCLIPYLISLCIYHLLCFFMFY